METNQRTKQQAGSVDPASSDPDWSLVQSAKAGDRAAFDVLALRHRNRIFHTILKIVRNRDDAEDQLQETLLRAFRALSIFRGDSRFVSWLTRIAINQALQSLRKRRHNHMSLDQSHAHGDDPLIIDIQELRPNPEDIYSRAEEVAWAQQTLQTLPASLKSVLILRLGQDATTEEVAASLGISVAAVKSRFLRGRRLLSASQTRPRRRRA